MGKMNRLANCHNQYQGDYKKVLVVCSAGILRSPTAAFVLSQEPFNYNTRACGLDEEFALIPLDEVLLEWADEIVCMDLYQAHTIKGCTAKPVVCLNIEDNFGYRQPELIKLIRENYSKGTGLVKTL